MERPEISEAQAAAYLREHYGLGEALHLQPLPSYADQNYLVEDAGRQSRFVFKIFDDEERWDRVDFVVAALRHLEGLDVAFPAPRVVADAQGRFIGTIGDGEEEEESDVHKVVLLTYVDGVQLAKCGRPVPLELVRSHGSFLASMDAALSGFRHPADEVYNEWCIDHALEETRKNLHHLPTESEEYRRRVALVERVCAEFEADALPLLGSARRQVIHGDAHDENTLVDATDGSRVVAIIDFGDMGFNFLPGNVAVAACYTMLASDNRELEAGRELIAAYHADMPLTREELRVVPWIIKIRVCVSQCMAARAAKTDPDNAHAQLGVDDKWELLEWLCGDVTPEELERELVGELLDALPMLPKNVEKLYE